MKISTLLPRRALLRVRLEGFWNQWRHELRECSAHLVVVIVLRVLTGFHKALRTFVVDALRYAFMSAKLSNAVFPAQAVQDIADLLFAGIPFARGAFDILDDLLAGALRCLSHLPRIGGYDEQQTLS